MSGFIEKLRGRGSVLGEIFVILWLNKKWWLIPLVVVLVLFGGLLALGSASSLAPFIYTLF